MWLKPLQVLSLLDTTQTLSDLYHAAWQNYILLSAETTLPKSLNNLLLPIAYTRGFLELYPCFASTGTW